MELTLDGLVRALRLTAHGLAEDAEAGYVRDERLTGRPAPSSFEPSTSSGLEMRATAAAAREDRRFRNEGFEE